MNRALRLPTLILVVLIVPMASARAASSHGPAASRPQTALTIFRLQVAGNVDRGTTFWVAYGPLAGKFGMVQLRQRSAGVYEASRILPTGDRSIFAYMVGHGAVKTQEGLVPGNPVTVVKKVGPLSVWPHGVPAVRWQAPVG